MRWRRPKTRDLVIPVAGVVLAVLGLGYAVRVSDASAVATWRRTLEQERDEHRVRVDAWLDAGRMTARLAAGYPTARYVVEGRTDEPRPFPATEGAVPHLAGLLADLCRETGFDAAFVVTASGTAVASTPGTLPSTEDLAAAREALAAADGRATLAPGPSGAVARFAAPIRAERHGDPAVGAVVLRQDASRQLYPAIHRRSAEEDRRLDPAATGRPFAAPAAPAAGDQAAAPAAPAAPAAGDQAAPAGQAAAPAAAPATEEKK